jgi:aminotransferase
MKEKGRMEYRFNERLSQVCPSEIRKFFELAQGKKDVINFGVGEPSFPTPQVICDAAKRALDEGYTHYSSNLGFMDLREAVAGKLSRENQIPVSSDHVMITLGAAQALFIALFALLNQGDEVIILEPAFNVYASVVRFCGGNPVAVSLDEASGFHVDFDRLQRAVTERTRGIVVNSPHNPTGCVFREQEIHGIAELASRRDLWVISDEVYEKIVYDENRHISIASLPGMSERTITVNSFSKAFAMTGWRIGYLAAPTPVVEQLLKVHQNSGDDRRGNAGGLHTTSRRVHPRHAENPGCRLPEAGGYILRRCPHRGHGQRQRRARIASSRT